MQAAVRVGEGGGSERDREGERERERKTERETEQVRGVLQDGGYKGWFRAREGCG